MESFDEAAFLRVRAAQLALRDMIKADMPDLRLGGIGIGVDGAKWVLQVNVVDGEALELPETFEGFPVHVEVVNETKLR